MTDDHQAINVGPTVHTELPGSQPPALELGQLTSLLSIAAGQIESLATALESACVDQEGDANDDPLSNQAVTDIRAVAAQIQARLAA